MKNTRLNLYHVDMKYIRDLHRIDDNVMSVSPQIGKESRTFIGIIVVCGMQKYCVPLTSIKLKHLNMRDKIDFTKIYDEGRPIAALNFNNMIPISEEQLIPVDIKIKKSDSKEVKNYKKLCQKEIAWCRAHQNDIVNKANVLYQKYISDEQLACRNRCLDFIRLEKACQHYNAKNKQSSNRKHNSDTTSM